MWVKLCTPYHSLVFLDGCKFRLIRCGESHTLLKLANQAIYERLFSCLFSYLDEIPYTAFNAVENL